MLQSGVEVIIVFLFPLLLPNKLIAINPVV